MRSHIVHSFGGRGRLTGLPPVILAVCFSDSVSGNLVCFSDSVRASLTDALSVFQTTSEFSGRFSLSVFRTDILYIAIPQAIFMDYLSASICQKKHSRFFRVWPVR